MRVDVKKFLFVGVEKDKNLFFENAQKLGVVEFIVPNAAKSAALDQEIQKYTTAIKILRALVPQEQIDNIAFENAPMIAEKIIELHTNQLKLHEEKRLLKLEAERVAFFGSFSLEEINLLEKEARLKFRYFYRIKPADASSQIEDPSLIFLGEEFGIEYYLSLENTHRTYEGVLEIKVDLPIDEIQKHQKEVEEKITLVEDELNGFARFNQFLHEALIFRVNHIDLTTAKNAAELNLEDKLFTIQGFVPISQIKQVKELAASMNIFMDEVEIESHDSIPTYLENENAAKVGEDLVHIYDTPSITDKDPSLWVLIAFIIFFAMIINDAGYGAIFLILTLYLKKKLKNISEVGSRILKLSQMISIACIIWGVITASYFGLEPSPTSAARNFSFLDWMTDKKIEYHVEHQDKQYSGWIKKYPSLAKNSDYKAFAYFENPSKADDYPIRAEIFSSLMFEIALFVGAVHVILSLIRNMRRNYAGLGWAIFIIGAYCYFPVMLNVTSLIHYVFGLPKLLGAVMGKDMIMVGIALAMILSIIQHRLKGMLEFTVVIQIFCDILSYLRLYALGLAGMMMAITFNDMAHMAGVVFGTLIIIVGHTINMGMGIMGGVIHGLRLNFLEWYHYSFEGGGRRFKPLKLYRK